MSNLKDFKTVTQSIEASEEAIDKLLGLNAKNQVSDEDENETWTEEQLERLRKHSDDLIIKGMETRQLSEKDQAYLTRYKELMRLEESEKAINTNLGIETGSAEWEEARMKLIDDYKKNKL